MSDPQITGWKITVIYEGSESKAAAEALRKHISKHIAKQARRNRRHPHTVQLPDIIAIGPEYLDEREP